MKSKRTNNTGSLRKRDDRKKSWQAQVALPNGKKLTRSFQREREANEWLSETTKRINIGMNVETSKMCLDKALLQWLSQNQEKWALSTNREYGRITRKYINPNLPKNLKLGDVKPSHMQAFFSLAKELKLGPRTRQLMKSILHKFFEDTRISIGLPMNPMHGVEVKYKPKSMSFFTKQQVAKLQETAKESPMEMLFFIALATGMREGEILGLTWKAIDWDSSSLIIIQQI